MDGWESRRKRVAGLDWALVRLGWRGVIRGFDVDTSHCIGNYPPAVSMDACVSITDDIDQLTGAEWTEILPATPLGPGSRHLLECSSQAALVEGGTERSITTQSMFWDTLLTERSLKMDAIHTFTDRSQLGPVSHVRFNILPDGGVSRLRLWGKVKSH